ncbi:SGNH/GDSL hydrolase family protein [Algoriphagus mannitolivorans]|uniref:SGNH/GDSL hydrolase family protein n=1 Tax=Algoriphagus mannitolivorans TaxID=226504 RepID=UPI0004052CB7|nr:SGNH/GDSL hydrolase family protein [Algoriphagus mannitolivorans]
MIFLFILSIGISLTSLMEKAPQSNDKSLSYLALGDSYTIGEGVPEPDRYPNQLVEMLNQTGKYSFSPAQIIAKTGWTVDELEAGIKASTIDPQGYDLVTLLIGVNNQYRGRPVHDYQQEFEELLKRAIAFARGNKDHVVVISIPDWGITPFAVSKGSDQAKVAREIDAYNAAKKAVCDRLGVKFVEITKHYRQVGAQPEMVVDDQLHPSGKVYQYWTAEVFKVVNAMKF